MRDSRFFKLSANVAVFILLVVLSFVPASALAGKPDLMSADVYKNGIDVTKYLVSEKLDGVRAYWDGKNLVSRGGNVFASPDWFTEGFPSEPMDGELWVGRNSFEQTVSIVRRKSPHSGWKKVKYMVFDLPGHEGKFRERHKSLKKIVAASESPYLKEVRQFRVRSRKELNRELDRVTESGGEGLMLHRKKALRKAGRSKDLLKLKKFYDAEAVVIAHNPGKGKFSGMLGSVTVETPEGVRFKIGTGFTNKQRRNPPAIGAVITYKYRGFTRKGKPRFASFWRVRGD